MIITGTKIGNVYKIHSPEFPYYPITYLGYTWKEVQQIVRTKYNLKHKKIEWMICGMDDEKIKKGA